MSEPNPDAGQTKPFVTIVVLVSGVAGGLLIVIAFVFFCKSCFKKKTPLTTDAGSKKKNPPPHIKDRFGYTILSGSTVESPVPADLETYLQQPKAENNNTEFAPDFAAVIDIQNVNYMNRQATSGTDDLELIIEAQEENSSNGKDQECDIGFPKFRQDSKTRHIENQLLMVPERQRAHSTSSPEKNLSLLNITEEQRRRSFDDRLRRGTGRLLPRALTHDEAYHATQFDQKYVFGLTQGHRHHPLLEKHRSLQSRVNPDLWTPSSMGPPPVLDRPKSPRSPLAHLPRSHQIVIEKASPPIPRKQMSSPLPQPNFNVIMPGEGDDNKQMYTQGHGNSMSWDVDTIDRCNRRWMFAQQPRMAYSFAATDSESRKFPPIVRQSSARLPEQSDNGMSGTGNEYDSLNKFYRQVQAVFSNKYAISTTSSSSDSAQQRLFVMSPSRRPAERQAKSLEVSGDYGSLGVSPLNRQTHSFDDRVSCVACRNDVMQRAGGHQQEHGAVPTLAQSRNRQQSVGLRRQRPLEEPDICQLEDATQEQLKSQCRYLWNLRGSIGDPMDDNGDDDAYEYDVDDGLAIAGCSIDEQEGISSEGTPYTTSFESNTEPQVEEYLRKHRPSGPFLEPPKLSMEAKRLKFKNLLARRQEQLQQTIGGSFETSVEKSFESYATYSSESSHIEMIPTSFESNTGEQTDDTADSQGRKSLAELKNDSGYKSQSTEAATNATHPSSIEIHDTNVHLETVSSQQRHPYKQSRDKQRVDAFFEAHENETDSRSDPGISGESFDDPHYVDQLPPVPPGRASGLPINPHLVRMRRSYESQSAGYYRMPITRDYSIDTKSDSIFREFIRFDPKLEPSTRRERRINNGPPLRYNYSSDMERRSRLQTKDSIEEEKLSPNVDLEVKLPSIPQKYGRQTSIPIIRLPDEQEVSS